MTFKYSPWDLRTRILAKGRERSTDAVLERTGETWEQFQKSVHSFARKRYRQILKEAKPTGK